MQNEKLIRIPTSFDIAIDMTIENICFDIAGFIDNFKICFPETKNPLAHLRIFPNATDENLFMIPIFDFCKVFNYIGLSIDENTDERSILLIACGCFFDPKLDYEILSQNEVKLNFEISILSEFIYAPN